MGKGVGTENKVIDVNCSLFFGSVAMLISEERLGVGNDDHCTGVSALLGGGRSRWGGVGGASMLSIFNRLIDRMYAYERGLSCL